MEPDHQSLQANAYARAGGALYLVIIVTALFAEAFVRGRVVVDGNAAATASHIMASPTLFRLGLAADLLNASVDVAVAVILYVLLKPVDKNLALLAALLRIAADAVLGLTGLLQWAVLVMLGGSAGLHNFTTDQVQSFAYLAMNLHGKGYAISMIFFGMGCGVLGYLIYHSRYLPRLIGVLLCVTCAGYLFNSFAGIVSPKAAAIAFPWTLMPGFFSELALCLWLLFKGVESRGRNAP